MAVRGRKSQDTSILIDSTTKSDYSCDDTSNPTAGAQGSTVASSPHPVEVLTARTFDAAAVNAVCNHPDVLPGLALGGEAVDVSFLMSDERNVAMLGKHGGALFHRVAPGVYAAHDFFLPSGRGSWALAASREMLRVIFRDFDARMIYAETPAENRACRMFNRWLGFISEGVSNAPLYPGAERQPIETFVMERAPCR